MGVAGLCYPTRQRLKSLDAHQNTLLVGLLGFRADFFGEFLHNTISKRRAARATLTALQIDPWSKRWATQTWRYWGHVVRNQMDTPLRYLAWRYSTFSLMSGDTWPGWVVNTPSQEVPTMLWGYTHCLTPSHLGDSSPRQGYVAAIVSTLEMPLGAG